jgi:ketosteroid isomerase-like protein
MKRVLPVALLALSLAAAARGQTPGDKPAADAGAERAVTQLIHQWLDALVAKDFAAIDRIVADDYLITISDGRLLNKEQDLAPVRDAQLKFASAKVEDLKVRVFGDTAIATGTGIYNVTYGERGGETRERFTDVWLKRKGRWQAVSSHSTTLPKPKS